tara:strand:+ start:6436 stop:6726 length:291 start_codon:yes stop_codon:yes gene_type:complete
MFNPGDLILYARDEEDEDDIKHVGYFIKSVGRIDARGGMCEYALVASDKTATILNKVVLINAATIEPKMQWEHCSGDHRKNTFFGGWEKKVGMRDG